VARGQQLPSKIEILADGISIFASGLKVDIKFVELARRVASIEIPE
jgi:hypothetical protein